MQRDKDYLNKKILILKTVLSMKILKTVLTVAVIALMASCSGGSGSSGKKLASNDILGDMPDLVYQYEYSDSVIKAKRDVEREKFKKDGTLDKSTWEKYSKMDAKFDAERDALKAKFDAEVEKLQPSLLGKNIPFELEDGCGYEVSSVKIIDLNKNSGAKVEFEVKITDESAFKIRSWGSVPFYFKTLDKDGNLIGKDYYGEERDESIIMSSKNGTTGKGNFYLADSKKVAAEMVNFAKIRFIKDPNINK